MFWRCGVAMWRACAAQSPWDLRFVNSTARQRGRNLIIICSSVRLHFNFNAEDEPARTWRNYPQVNYHRLTYQSLSFQAPTAPACTGKSAPVLRIPSAEHAFVCFFFPFFQKEQKNIWLIEIKNGGHCAVASAGTKLNKSPSFLRLLSCATYIRIRHW